MTEKCQERKIVGWHPFTKVYNSWDHNSLQNFPLSPLLHPFPPPEEVPDRISVRGGLFGEGGGGLNVPRIDFSSWWKIRAVRYTLAYLVVNLYWAFCCTPQRKHWALWILQCTDSFSLGTGHRDWRGEGWDGKENQLTVTLFTYHKWGISRCFLISHLWEFM